MRDGEEKKEGGLKGGDTDGRERHTKGDRPRVPMRWSSSENELPLRALRNQLNIFNMRISSDSNPRTNFRSAGNSEMFSRVKQESKVLAPWEDRGADRRPRPKFLAVCFRKEGADRGSI